MADSVDAAIGELPQAEYIDDSDRIPLEQGGVAKYVLGALLKAFIDRNILDVRALTLPAGSDVTASYNAETGVLTLGIPRSLGAANSVDGVAADTSGDVPLGAVSCDRGQSLTNAQKTRALANLGLSFINLLGGTIALDGFTVTQGAEQIYPFQSGASYCKLPDGTLIQWGDFSSFTLSNSFLSGTISFPLPFVDSNFKIMTNPGRNCIAYLNSPICEGSVSGNIVRTVNSCVISAKGTSANISIQYLAVGRWK